MSFLIDTHCHLDHILFDDDRKQVVQQCKLSGVPRIVLPGVELTGWHKQWELSQEYPSLFIAPGLHPCFMASHDENHLDQLVEFLVKNPDKVVGVGETGLDFSLENRDEKQQEIFFIRQIEIAKTQNLPLILHVRKAHDRVFKLLKEQKFSEGGIVHCYSGSLQQAENYLKLGFKLGIGGVITNPRAFRLQKIAKNLPLSAFVLETDAPDIPLANRRGERNSPEYLPEILNGFGNGRKESLREVKEQLYQNSITLFPKLRS